jgi:hypothetical protein
MLPGNVADVGKRRCPFRLFPRVSLQFIPTAELSRPTRPKIRRVAHDIATDHSKTYHLGTCLSDYSQIPHWLVRLGLSILRKIVPTCGVVFCRVLAWHFRHLCPNCGVTRGGGAAIMALIPYGQCGIGHFCDDLESMCSSMTDVTKGILYSFRHMLVQVHAQTAVATEISSPDRSRRIITHGGVISRYTLCHAPAHSSAIAYWQQITLSSYLFPHVTLSDLDTFFSYSESHATSSNVSLRIRNEGAHPVRERHKNEGVQY